jgi:hypothetical protein
MANDESDDDRGKRIEELKRRAEGTRRRGVEDRGACAVLPA